LKALYALGVQVFQLAQRSFADIEIPRALHSSTPPANDQNDNGNGNSVEESTAYIATLTKALCMGLKK